YFIDVSVFFFFQAEDGIRDFHVTGVQTCALPIFLHQVGKANEIDAVAALNSLHAQPHGQMCLADSRRAQQNDVCSPFHEGHGRSSPFLSVKGPALMHWLTGPLAETSADRRPAGRLRRLASSHELWPAGVVHAPRSGLLASAGSPAIG